ncbi:MAG: MATE family efflux transporter, partial [Leptothrix sp. (in: b-proteobacteria)]
MARAALPQLRKIAVPILGESIVGMSVAMAGLWLASGLSEVASGAFGLCGQIGETLFVIFRVLGIGLGVSITQALGGGRPKLVRQIALTGFAASSWAGLAAALWVLLVNDWTLAALNAPDEVHQLAAPYLRLLALGLFVDAYNVTMATVLRALLHSHDALKGMLLM